MANRAIINVEDTEGILPLAKYLSESGWDIFCSGKTASLLSSNGIHIKSVYSLASDKNNRESFSALVENITGQEFFYETVEDEKSKQQKLLVCINFVPEYTHPKDIRDASKIASNIYDRGAALIQFAAKNFQNVISLTDPHDYGEAIIRLRTDNFSTEYRLYLAAKSLNMLSAYNAAIASSIFYKVDNSRYPKYLTLPYHKVMSLSHGMNKQQASAYYTVSNVLGATSGFKKLQGRQSTFETIANINAAWKAVFRFSKFLKNPYAVTSVTHDGATFTTRFTPAAGNVFTVIVNYGTIEGAALGESAYTSCEKTLANKKFNFEHTTIACSSTIDEKAAEAIVKSGVATVIAPSYTAEAKKVFEGAQDMRICTSSHVSLYDNEFISIDGGIVVQREDDMIFDSWKIATQARPTQNQSDAAAFGMLCLMSTKYDAVVIVSDMAICFVQCGKLESLSGADYISNNNVECGEGNKNGAVLVCNCVLPFTENTRRTVESQNVAAIIQTGGAAWDDDFVSYCNEKNIAMIFTGITHISL